VVGRVVGHRATANLLCELEIQISNRVHLAGGGGRPMAHVSYDVLECELGVMIHDRVGQVKTRVGEDLPKDLLPPLVTLESNHPAKQPFVRVEAEDGAT
jgi:hypothetical protein